MLPEPQLPTVHPRPEEEEEDAANVVAQSLVGDQTLREGGREGRGGEGGEGGEGREGGRGGREGETMVVLQWNFMAHMFFT